MTLVIYGSHITNSLFRRKKERERGWKLTNTEQLEFLIPLMEKYVQPSFKEQAT
jgi:hypothetical protein